MDGKNYSAVPPPSSLTTPSKGAAPLDFNDALSKARAIAEKLKQQTSSASESAPAATSSTSYSSSSGKKAYVSSLSQTWKLNI
jgi:far upstream element-binding protein